MGCCVVSFAFSYGALYCIVCCQTGAANMGASVGNELMSCCIMGAAAAEDGDYE